MIETCISDEMENIRQELSASEEVMKQIFERLYILPLKEIVKLEKSLKNSWLSQIEEINS